MNAYLTTAFGKQRIWALISSKLRPLYHTKFNSGHPNPKVSIVIFKICIPSIIIEYSVFMRNLCGIHAIAIIHERKNINTKSRGTKKTFLCSSAFSEMQE